MFQVIPFRPENSSTVKLAATSASSTATLQSGGSTGTANSHRVRVYNSGPNDCAIEFGMSSVSATFPSGSTGSSMVVPAGAVEVFTSQSGTVAAITSTSGNTAGMFFTIGEGL
jgi:hypothetical protein